MPVVGEVADLPTERLAGEANYATLPFSFAHDADGRFNDSDRNQVGKKIVGKRTESAEPSVQMGQSAKVTGTGLLRCGEPRVCGSQPQVTVLISLPSPVFGVDK